MKAWNRWIAYILTMSVALPADAVAAPGVEKRTEAATPTVAEDAAEERIGVVVVIDASLIDLMPDVLIKRLTFLTNKRIGESNMDERSDGRARIDIVLRPGSQKQHGFDYSVKGQIDERPVNVTDNSGLCVPCSHEEVVKVIDPIVVRQLAALREAANAPPVEAAQGPATLPPPEVERGPGDRTAKRLTGLGHAGIGVLVAGALGAIAGGALVGVSPKDERYDDDSSRGRRFDARIGGGIALGLGAIGIVVGATMLGIDAKRQRSKRSGSAKRADGRSAKWRGGARGLTISF